MAPARLHLIAILVALMALAVSGCNALPSAEPGISAPVAARATERALGFKLERVPDAPAVATIPNLQRAYAGRGRRESALVLVMDSSAAGRQVTGGLQQVAGTRVVSRRNVLVLYTRLESTSDRSRRIAELLRAASG